MTLSTLHLTPAANAAPLMPTSHATPTPSPPLFTGQQPISSAVLNSFANAQYKTIGVTYYDSAGNFLEQPIWLPTTTTIPPIYTGLTQITQEPCSNVSAGTLTTISSSRNRLVITPPKPVTQRVLTLPAQSSIIDLTNRDSVPQNTQTATSSTSNVDVTQSDSSSSADAVLSTSTSKAPPTLTVRTTSTKVSSASVSASPPPLSPAVSQEVYESWDLVKKTAYTIKRNKAREALALAGLSQAEQQRVAGIHAEEIKRLAAEKAKLDQQVAADKAKRNADEVARQQLLAITQQAAARQAHAIQQAKVQAIADERARVAALAARNAHNDEPSENDQLREYNRRLHERLEQAELAAALAVSTASTATGNKQKKRHVSPSAKHSATNRSRSAAPPTFGSQVYDAAAAALLANTTVSPFSVPRTRPHPTSPLPPMNTLRSKSKQALNAANDAHSSGVEWSIDDEVVEVGPTSLSVVDSSRENVASTNNNNNSSSSSSSSRPKVNFPDAHTAQIQIQFQKELKKHNNAVAQYIQIMNRNPMSVTGAEIVHACKCMFDSVDSGIQTLIEDDHDAWQHDHIYMDLSETNSGDTNTPELGHGFYQLTQAEQVRVPNVEDCPHTYDEFFSSSER